MSNYFNNIYFLAALIISMIIHLLLLMSAELSFKHREFISPIADIEISFMTQIPDYPNIQGESAAIPITPAKNITLTKPSNTKKTNTPKNKIIESQPVTLINEPEPIKIKSSSEEINTVAASVKEELAPKKLISIDSNQILSQIGQSIPSNAEQQQSKLRTKTISSSTTDYEYRLYFESWRQKVERIGALNYPEAAKSGVLGSLRLTVSLTSDGNIESIIIDKSSGHSALDEAAISIVRMGAPYARFSSNMNKDVDIIRITRTWKFTEENKFSSQ